MDQNWFDHHSEYVACKNRGDLSGAIEGLKSAIELALTAAPEEVATMYNSLTVLYLEKGRLDLALDSAGASIGSEIDNPSGHLVINDRLATYLEMMAKVLIRAGKLREAVRYMDMSIDEFVKAHGSDESYVVGLQIEREELLRQIMPQ